MIKIVFNWLEAHQGKAGTLTGYYQQAASALAAIFVIPLVIHLLPSVHAGAWFAFQGILQVISLTNFGLVTTLSRQVAFTKNAQSGSDASREGDFLNLPAGRPGVVALFQLTQPIYLGLIALGTVLVVIIGECILPMGKLLGEENSDPIRAWYLLGAASLLILAADRYRGFLIGLGRLSLGRVAVFDRFCLLIRQLGKISAFLGISFEIYRDQ